MIDDSKGNCQQLINNNPISQKIQDLKHVKTKCELDYQVEPN